MNKTTIKTIGLTGGIGSGKTVATDALRANGYTVIDADEVSRTLFSRGSAGEKLLMSIFPTATANGHLDRAELRRMISEKNAEREKLNAATHPAIIAEVKRLLDITAPPVILSAPLLFESGLDKLCDKTVCIYCPFTVQIKRITERDGIDESAALSIVMAQMSNLERIKLSDHHICSDVPIKEFTDAVLKLINDITKANG